MRTGLLAQALAAKGHEVLWWASAFEHARKRHRSHEDKVIEAGDSFRIWLMRARGYRSGRSIGRMLDHMGIARRFRRLARTEPPPDIIVAGMPTPGLALAATDYGREKNVPVVLDVRDMWPECFVWSAPWFLRPVVYLASLPAARAVHLAASRATAIVGITRAFVEWGLQYAKRAAAPLDRAFPHGYPERSPQKEQLDKAEQFWAGHGLTGQGEKLVACFFGYMGHDFDLETVIEAAKAIKKENLPWAFVLCGTGGNFERYSKLAEGTADIVFPGWVSFDQIWTLMRLSSVGLAPYFNTKSFCASIPNKIIEYLSAGLPIVSSLQGVSGKLLSDQECGLTYRQGDSEGLARALRELHGNIEKREKMSANARALFKKTFAAEKVYSGMAEYLERVLDAYRAGRQQSSGR
jgi:glycosyltransferase involved in cell wall biosynthesis